MTPSQATLIWRDVPFKCIRPGNKGYHIHGKEAYGGCRTLLFLNLGKTFPHKRGNVEGAQMQSHKKSFLIFEESRR
jgi:hypothetical protein